MNAGVTASSRHGLSEDALFRKARGEFHLFSDDEADDFIEFAEKKMKDPRGPKELEPGKIDYEWLVRPSSWLD